MYQMGVPKDEYHFCVGLEDTEPGIIALRAAGVGCAVALPNRDTSRQNYAAATEIVRGGLPEPKRAMETSSPRGSWRAL